MNNEIIESIMLGTLELAFIGGMILYVIQVVQEMRNNHLKNEKEIELLDIKILEVKNRIK